MTIQAIREKGRGAKAAQEGLLGTIRGYWGVLCLVTMSNLLVGIPLRGI